jgi:hypothetical protein
MARSSLGGDDPDHQLPDKDKDKDKRETELRAQAREQLVQGNAKRRRELENRARNISRKESRRAQHH